MATAIIQARMGSTRLPGKVLKKINGKPLLSYIVESLKRSSVIDKTIIATSENKENDIIEKYCKNNTVICFRGSEDNVLERYYKVSEIYPDKYYFRATADNPILDIKNPEITLNHLIENNLDYAAVKGMPVGTIVECFTKSALDKAYREAESKEDKEHVTLYMKKNKGFRVGYLQAEESVRFPKMRLTVDYPEDFEKAETIIKALYNKEIPDFQDIVDFVNKRSDL